METMRTMGTMKKNTKLDLNSKIFDKSSFFLNKNEEFLGLKQMILSSHFLFIFNFN